MTADQKDNLGEPCYFCGAVAATRSVSQTMHQPKTEDVVEIHAPACKRCRFVVEWFRGAGTAILFLSFAAGALAGWFAVGGIFQNLDGNPSIASFIEISLIGIAKFIVLCLSAFAGMAIAALGLSYCKEALRKSLGLIRMDLISHPAVIARSEEGYIRGTPSTGD